MKAIDQRQDYLANQDAAVLIKKKTLSPIQSNLSYISSDQDSNIAIVPKHSFSEMSLYPPVIVQPKLTINQPNDIYEQEADAIADKVMRMPDKEITASNVGKEYIQRKCKECEEEEKGLQRKESNNAVPSVSAVVDETLQSQGQPMDIATRHFMEARFGHDFSKVQIHNHSLANQSAKDVHALAYTHGSNIIFGAGQCQPNTVEGKKLMAHELTHVVQQQNNLAFIQKKPPPTTTPTPKDGKAQKQGGFILKLDYIKITGLPDVHDFPKERPHEAHTYLSKPTISLDNPDYKLDPTTKLVTSFVAYKPLQIDLTIETNYATGVKPEGPSDYGYGTRAEDVKKKTTSIKFHEGSHGSLFVEYIRKEIAKHPLPQFEGKVGMTEGEFLQKDKEYVQKVSDINKMILDAINYATITVDCAGTSIDTHNAKRKNYVNICP